MSLLSIVLLFLHIRGLAELPLQQPRVFVVPVDSIQVPNTLRMGDTLCIRFWGTIGTNACYAFSHFEIRQDSLKAEITVWGTLTPAEICAQVMVEMLGKELKLVAKKRGTFIIVVHQPGGSMLRRHVKIE
jgi:hypothetical protein